MGVRRPHYYDGTSARPSPAERNSGIALAAGALFPEAGHLRVWRTSGASWAYAPRPGGTARQDSGGGLSGGPGAGAARPWSPGGAAGDLFGLGPFPPAGSDPGGP